MATHKTALKKEALFFARYMRRKGYKTKVSQHRKKYSPYHWKVTYTKKK